MRKPLTGAILGYLLGLAIAVVLQQQGVWPLDQVTVFLIPGVLGAIGLLLLTVGREGATVTYVISLIILIPALVWGALGLADAGETGVLNGGCVVTADTSVPDSTMVTDTSRGDPFQIDPGGSLTWAAASPTIFMDYDWEMWTDIGGFPVVFDSDHEDNEGGSPANGDTVANVGEYAEAQGVNITNFTGVFKVGGFASTCDGFGFVVLLAEGLTTPSIIAGAIALIILIILIIMVFTGRGAETVVSSVTAMGADGQEVPPEIFTDGFESGDTSRWGDTEP